MAHWNKIFIKGCKLMLIFLLLSSCARSISNYLPVRPDDAVEIDGDASDDFKQGWKDGCETGMSAGSNTFYKSFYRNNATDGWKIANSPDYKTAWDNSFWFCYRHDYFKQKISIWGSVFSGYR